MKTNRINQSLLLTSVKVLARDYKKYILSFLGVMTFMYLVEFIVALSSGNIKIGGIEGVYGIACFVSGLFTFKEEYYFLTQNQVPKATITKAFIIEGFCFGILTSFMVNIFFHLMQWISHSLGLYTPGFFALIPIQIDKGGVIGFGQILIILIFLYVTTYFIGLLLATINYRLNWLGRIIFWVPFGIITLNGLIGSLEYLIDKVAIEDLDVPSLILAKPFINGLNWTLQSLGNFIIVSSGIIIICLILGTLLFRGAEIKYSNVK
ncbi:MAG: hypothetical protein GX328_01840 [Clostridiaceae bacterium]|nr:hypothetical protein [Clostridiaceae bacterium]